MLNLSGVFKLISVKANGTAKNGRKYVNVLAVDFFNQPTEEERNAGVKCQFFMLKAFGDTANFILRNFNDSNGTRRAFVSGEIQLDTYKTTQPVKKTITHKGQKGTVEFDVEVDRTSVGVIVNDIRFLDKPNAKASSIEFKVDNEEEDIVKFTVTDDSETNKPVGEHKNIIDNTPTAEELQQYLDTQDDVVEDNEIE